MSDSITSPVDSQVYICNDGRQADAATSGSSQGDGSKAPPLSNRGVLSTFKHNQNDFILDWLSSTLPFSDYTMHVDQDGVIIPMPDNLDAVRFLFGELELQERNFYRGYTHTALLECGGRVAWHADNPMQKVLIDLSGSALADLACPAQELICNLLASGAAFTRLDVARDDFDGTLDLGEIEQAARSGNVVSRFRKGRTVNGFELGNTQVAGGYTVYFGSDSSSVKVRFYDKKTEQAQKGQEVDFAHWVRCEAQFRGEAAQKLAQAIFENGHKVGEVLAGVFLNYLDFKESGEDSNKSRWSTSAWWSAFLAVSDKVRLGLGRVARTVQQAQQWVVEGVSIVLASLQVIDVVWLNAAIEAGKKMMMANKRHSRRLDRWRREQALSGNFQLGFP